MHERFRQNACENGIVAFRVLVKIAVRRKPGIVQEKIANGDASAPGGIRVRLRGGCPFRQIARDSRVEIQALLLHQHHYRSGGDDDLGERSHVIQRARGYRGRFCVACELAERAHDQLIAKSNGQNATWNCSIRYRAVH